jgi:hypothetical protein
VRLEGLGNLKKCSDLIGNRTRDLPACSIVPQPTTLPRAQSRSGRRGEEKILENSSLCRDSVLSHDSKLA